MFSFRGECWADSCGMSGPLESEDALREFVRGVMRQEPRPTLGLHVVCTAATLPASPVPGLVVFVSDGGAGAKYRGWDGSAWVNLG